MAETATQAPEAAAEAPPQDAPPQGGGDPNADAAAAGALRPLLIKERFAVDPTTPLPDLWPRTGATSTGLYSP